MGTRSGSSRAAVEGRQRTYRHRPGPGRPAPKEVPVPGGGAGGRAAGSPFGGMSPSASCSALQGSQGLACASTALGFGGPWRAASGERTGPRGVQVRQEGAYRLRPLLGPRESQLFWSPLREARERTAREPVDEGTWVSKAAGDILSSSAGLAQAGCRSSGVRGLQVPKTYHQSESWRARRAGAGAYRWPESSDRWTEAYCQGAVDTAPGPCTGRARSSGAVAGSCAGCTAARVPLQNQGWTVCPHRPSDIRHQAARDARDARFQVPSRRLVLVATASAERRGRHAMAGACRPGRPGLKPVRASLFSAAHMESMPMPVRTAPLRRP